MDLFFGLLQLLHGKAAELKMVYCLVLIISLTVRCSIGWSNLLLPQHSFIEMKFVATQFVVGKKEFLVFG